MMIALHVAAASMNARLMLFQKVTSTLSIPMYAQIVVHAQMFVRLKQFIPNKIRLPGFAPGQKQQKARNLWLWAFLLKKNVMPIKLLQLSTPGYQFNGDSTRSGG